MSRSAIVVALFAATTLPVRAQERALDAVRVRVALVDGTAARVTVEYRMRVPAGDSVLLAAVPYFDLGIAEPSANGVPVTPAGMEIRAVPRAGVLELRYTVPAAALHRGAGIDLRVPVLLPRGLPAASSEDFFRAELDAGPALHVVESFPTVALEGDTHAMTLPVAPGLLRWRLVEGDPPRVTFAGLVDAGVLLALVVLSVLGVRGLRRTARDA